LGEVAGRRIKNGGQKWPPLGGGCWKKRKKMWAKIANTWGRLLEEEEKIVGKNSLHLGEVARRRLKIVGKNSLHLEDLEGEPIQ
jgi:hypothetical protein